MKKNAFLFFLLLSALLFTACESDDNDKLPKPGTGTSTTVNVNKNPTDVYASVRRLEFPRIKGDANDMVIIHSTADYGINYALEWDKSKRAQRWTCYEMYAGNSGQNWYRSEWENTEWGGDPFQVDPDIPESYRSELSDYKYSGYNRGHICASQDRVNSKDANEQTFYLSNMHPQIGGFNSGVWGNMEMQVRAWNTNASRDILYVCKGGTIDNSSQIINDPYFSKLIVPKYFFMAILKVKNGTYDAIAFWIEHKVNSDTNLAKYAISIDQLEKNTGIDFFCNLPDDIENQVEARCVPSDWGLK